MPAAVCRWGCVLVLSWCVWGWGMGRCPQAFEGGTPISICIGLVRRIQDTGEIQVNYTRDIQNIHATGEEGLPCLVLGPWSV